MKKLLIIVLSLLSLTAQAKIDVQIEPSQVVQGETFQLTLTQENAQDTSVPALNVLQTDFIILGTERSVNYSIINGRAQSASQWVISLQSKKKGIVTIPAIKFGNEQTSSLTINVAAASSAFDSQNDKDNASQDDDLFISVSANETKPYVNQQIVYTVKLYNRKRLLNGEFQGPQATDALLIPLGDSRRYQTTRNNKEYIVEEINYAIFPQKSGTLKIESPVFSALVYDLNPQRVSVHDEPLKLKVQSIPKDYTGKVWLPAQAINLTEKYENTTQTISQGSTLVRTIELEGVAVPGQLLPTLAFKENQAFNVYPEKGHEQNVVKQGVLVGSVATKVTYLFKEAGKVIIPEVKVPWFNTTTGKMETATLPPRSIEVTPSAALNTQSAVQSDAPQETSAPKTPNATKTTNLMDANNKGWAVAALFALLWLITLGLWRMPRRGLKNQSMNTQYKNALQAFNKACANGDPVETRDALLAFAALHWPDASVLNLTDLAHLIPNAHLKSQLHLLSQALYKSEEPTSWRGEDLARSMEVFLKIKPVKEEKKTNSLPPINKLC